MKKIILALALFPTLASAAQSKPISLELEYFHDGRFLCGGTRTVQSGQETAFCDGAAGAKKLALRTKASYQARNQVLVSSIMEEIDHEGKAKVIASPQIMVLMGEESVMAQVSERPEVDESGYKLTIRASRSR